MSKSNFERDLYLNGRFRDGGAIAALGTVYVALASADLTAANLTANELPIGTGGYARIAIGTTNADWAAPATSGGARMIANVSSLSGGTATANLNGGNPVGFYGIYDAATAGNLIRYGALAIPRTFLTGDAIVIPPGALQILES
jgi:hypothetical protein